MWRILFLLLCLVTAFSTCSARGASIVDPNLFNADTNSGGDQPAGLSTGISATNPIPGDDPRDAFGNNDGPGEATAFIFNDGRTADNGNGIFGDLSESTDFLTWSTNSVVVIDGYRYNVSSDGPDPSRGTQLLRLAVEGEIDDLYDNDNTNGETSRLFSVPQVGNSFEFGLTHNHPNGARVEEIDAIVTSTAGAVVDPDIWNAVTNGGGDQPAGLSTNITASSKVEGIDTPEDAFGNNNGLVEGDNFMFGNEGTNDNGDNLAGNGGETVDFIEWHTTSLIQLEGYQVGVAGDNGGVEDATRSTELVRLLVEGNLVDTIDLNGHSGAFLRLFSGGAVIGDDFRIEFTRHNGSQRIFEIDAVNAVVVPEPGACGMLLVGVAWLLCRRWHRRSEAT